MFTIQLDTDVIKFVVKLLIVRYFQDILGELAGYNVIFIELNPSTQENVINGCFLSHDLTCNDTMQILNDGKKYPSS